MSKKSIKICNKIIQKMETNRQYQIYLSHVDLVYYCLPRWRTILWSATRLRRKGIKLWDEYIYDIRKLLIQNGYEVEGSLYMIDYRMIKIKHK